MKDDQTTTEPFVAPELAKGLEQSQIGRYHTMVSRPKELPFLEGEHDMRPSEYHDLMSQPPMQEPDLFDPQDWTPD